MNRSTAAAKISAIAIACTLTAFTTPAQASGYASAAMKQIECGQAGERAAEYRRKRTIDGRTIEQWMKAINEDGKHSEAEKAWGIALGTALTIAFMPQIRTPQEAHAAAWAYCMDN